MVTTCNGDGDGMQRWHAGLSYGVFGSNLSFIQNVGVGIERRAVSASVEYRVSPTTTFGGGAGAGLGGLITPGAERYRILPGWMVTGTYSRRLVDGTGKKPFVLFGLALGASGASTREEVRHASMPATAGLYAIDIRGALTAGKTFWNTLSPYVSARAFGGPVFWRYRDKTVVGGDTHHYQLALGMVAALPRGIDLFADVAPLGERAVALGAGKSF